MSIKTVADLIAALERLPGHLPVGTMTRDYVGEKFEATVRVDTEWVTKSGRIAEETSDKTPEVVVIR